MCTHVCKRVNTIMLSKRGEAVDASVRGELIFTDGTGRAHQSLSRFLVRNE
jgi:hypothetical protein